MKVIYAKVFLFFLIPFGSLYSCPADTVKTVVIAHNLGSKINTAAEEFGQFCIDNYRLYFVSKRPATALDHLWVSKKNPQDSSWSVPEPLKSLNNDYAIGALSFDDSGVIYFASNNQSEKINDMNIWEGTVIGKNLSITQLPYPVNTDNWECQPSVTGDGKDLYFASNRNSPPGMRSRRVNMFVSHKKQDGRWTTPENLGPHINMGDYNGTPFITADGAFLFFSSDGKGDSGNRKIYMSTRVGPKDNDWSESILLPSQINADGDTMFPMIASDGKTIYFSSNRAGGYGGFDIYETELPSDIQEKIAVSFHRY